MSIHYDSLEINRDIRLDLPIREGVGAVTHDVAKPHHPVTLVNTPAWTTLDSHLGCLTLDGATEYLQSLNADTVDLQFTAGDYGIGGWFFWQTGDDSQILIGRYAVDVGGWEVYLYDDPSHYLTVRHHHSAGATTRTACYTDGWVKNTWHFLGISREGGAITMWRGDTLGNITQLVSTCSAGGVLDPEATVSDLVIGARFSKNSDFHKGMFWRYRIWGDRALTEADWEQVYRKEVRWFA